MAMIAVLTKHIIEELTIRNDTIEPHHTPFQIKPEIRFQMFPKQENKPIQTLMTVEIGNMDDNSPLYIKLRVRGLFLSAPKPGDDEPDDANLFHKLAFTQLFNTARTIISGATLMGGMAPINLAPINPANLNVQKNS